MIRTRFAPSPTGRLHLGHAWSALVAEARARQGNGRFLLRIDDLDTGRVRREYRDAIDEDLRWLGLTPDEPPVMQSQRKSHYADALERLRADGLLYPCFCTRAQIAAELAAMGGAPHADDGTQPYPGTCRTLDKAQAAERIARGDPHSWRINMGRASDRTGPLTWQDERRGVITADPQMHGDVILVGRDAAFAYHLASTLDDAFMGITHVVRGADLFASTHVHRLLQALLGLPTPVYHHHALVADADGRRLAKRHDAASIATMRASGVDPVRLMEDMRHGTLPLGYCWAAE